jgi:hypothetical protein
VGVRLLVLVIKGPEKVPEERGMVHESAVIPKHLKG